MSLSEFLLTLALLEGLVSFATAKTGDAEARQLEKNIFELASRLTLIFSAGKLPADFDWSRLSDETQNFCQDFLLYSRDQRLKEQRGLTAEIQSLDVPELLRAGHEITSDWRKILAPHASQKVLSKYDHLTHYFICDSHLRAILLEQKHRPQLIKVDASLRTLFETY